MKKRLMIILFIFFVLLLVLLAVYFSKRVSSPSDSLPIPSPTPIRPALEISPTTAPAKDILEIKSDLQNIKNDIEKLKKEDGRFFPPEFLFDLGI